MYAVPGSVAATSRVAILAQAGTSLGVTSVQEAPASRVSLTRPSSVPIQIVSLSRRDSPMLKITPYPQARARAASGSPPHSFAASPLAVASGLILVQCAPRSSERNSTWAPWYSGYGETLDTAMGVIHV